MNESTVQFPNCSPSVLDLKNLGREVLALDRHAGFRRPHDQFYISRNNEHLKIRFGAIFKFRREKRTGKGRGADVVSGSNTRFLAGYGVYGQCRAQYARMELKIAEHPLLSNSKVCQMKNLEILIISISLSTFCIFSLRICSISCVFLCGLPQGIHRKYCRSVRKKYKMLIMIFKYSIF